MSDLLEKTREVLYSVLPVTIIVLLLHFTITPLGAAPLLRFLLGAFFIVLGLTFFLFGVERAIAPLGNLVGERLVKSNRLVPFIITVFILGFVITLAEPGLVIFSGQVHEATMGQVDPFALLIVVSAGIGAFLVFALIRIVFKLELYKMLIFLYMLIFVLGILAEPEFIVIAFDASGATTGVLAVPFILALSLGISRLEKSSLREEESSFGTIALVSAGAILAVMLYSVLSPDTEFLDAPPKDEVLGEGVLRVYLNELPDALFETFLVFFPLFLVFIVVQLFFLQFKTERFMRFMGGFAYGFLGIFLFLLGVNAGFLEVGSLIGGDLASSGAYVYSVGVAFLLGVVAVIAEPAVYVLKHQVEDVTSGYVSRNAVLVALSIGVGFAVALAALRVFIEPLEVWHYLLPGYFLAVALTFFTPKTFVGLAFDGGGVATGPVIASFVLAFMHGAAASVDTADIIRDGFGMIAMVAMMPIITLQILGLIFRVKTKKKGV